jgi:hypothetical protein
MLSENSDVKVNIVEVHMRCEVNLNRYSAVMNLKQWGKENDMVSFCAQSLK